MSRLILLAVLLAPAAHAAKPTSAQACEHLVSVQAGEYQVSLEPMAQTAFEGACQEIFDTADKKVAKKTRACVMEEGSVLMLSTCSDLADKALEATNPFEPAMRDACVNQVRVSVAHAGGGLSDAVHKQLFDGCMNDMKLQLAFNSPREMAEKTQCMTKATEQAASERCWN